VDLSAQYDYSTVEPLDAINQNCPIYMHSRSMLKNIKFDYDEQVSGNPAQTEADFYEYPFCVNTACWAYFGLQGDDDGSVTELYNWDRWYSWDITIENVHFRRTFRAIGLNRAQRATVKNISGDVAECGLQITDALEQNYISNISWYTQDWLQYDDWLVPWKRSNCMLFRLGKMDGGIIENVRNLHGAVMFYGFDQPVMPFRPHTIMEGKRGAWFSASNIVSDGVCSLYVNEAVDVHTVTINNVNVGGREAGRGWPIIWVKGSIRCGMSFSNIAFGSTVNYQVFAKIESLGGTIDFSGVNQAYKLAADTGRGDSDLSGSQFGVIHDRDSTTTVSLTQQAMPFHNNILRPRDGYGGVTIPDYTDTQSPLSAAELASFQSPDFGADWNAVVSGGATLTAITGGVEAIVTTPNQTAFAEFPVAAGLRAPLCALMFDLECTDSSNDDFVGPLFEVWLVDSSNRRRLLFSPRLELPFSPYMWWHKTRFYIPFVWPTPTMASSPKFAFQWTTPTPITGRTTTWQLTNLDLKSLRREEARSAQHLLTSYSFRDNVSNNNLNTGAYLGSRLEVVYSEPPTEGAWEAGDVVWRWNGNNTVPMGWVCVVAGTPGTWRAYQNIGALA
jgi:hypothetical protein